MIFADTSFIVSILTNDPNTLKARNCLKTAKEALQICPLTRLEVISTLGRKVKGNKLTSGEQASARLLFERLCDARQLITTPVDDARVWSRAFDLSERFSAELGLRSLDIWHVAYALEVGADELWSFDERQCDLANACALKSHPMS